MLYKMYIGKKLTAIIVDRFGGGECVGAASFDHFDPYLTYYRRFDDYFDIHSSLPSQHLYRLVHDWPIVSVASAHCVAVAHFAEV